LGSPYTFKDFIMTTHPALTAGRMAVITGAASGIGLATAKRMVSLGLRVCLVDIDEVALDMAKAELSAIGRIGGLDDLAVTADVSDPVAVAKLKNQVLDTAGNVAAVMCNAGMEPPLKSLGKRWQLAADHRRQPVGRDPLRPSLCPGHARSRHARRDHRHRLEARHHLSAGQYASLEANEPHRKAQRNFV
jgi:NAD(P)-dependent dehydrogenase (short-subunit alcohol dehydrogenase family)